MHNPTQESAMTEIALALAMGFFSLMVLTLLSMGVEPQSSKAPEVQNMLAVDSVVLAPAQQPRAENSGRTKTTADDVIVIFDGHGFFDTDLKPVTPSEITAMASQSSRRIILALKPQITLQSAMQARAQIKSDNLIVSNLDQKWLAALSQRQGQVRGGNND